MAISLDDKIKALPAKRRKKVAARAAELIAEELSLRDLRKARAKTQTALARELGVGQEGISRLEKRSDLMLSTLRGYVEAMGGELHLIAEFPDRPPVHLRGLAVMDQANKAARHAPRKKSSKAE
jgi:DNA-binding XRE family transcriptional regulator